MTERDIHHFAAHATMASISSQNSGECFDFDSLSASCLGGLMLKREQKEAVSRLLEGKDVLAVLPTGFGKSLIYQSFVLAKDMIESSVGFSSGRPSCPVMPCDALCLYVASSRSRSTQTSSILK